MLTKRFDTFVFSKFIFSELSSCILICCNHRFGHLDLADGALAHLAFANCVVANSASAVLPVAKLAFAKSRLAILVVANLAVEHVAVANSALLI